MPKPRLHPKFSQLESDIIETLIAGLKEWRPDLSYPESHSDMSGCVRALIRMFDIKRRPIALSELPCHCELCNDAGKLIECVDDDPHVIKEKTCPACQGKNRWLR